MLVQTHVQTLCVCVWVCVLGATKIGQPRTGKGGSAHNRMWNMHLWWFGASIKHFVLWKHTPLPPVRIAKYIHSRPSGNVAFPTFFSCDTVRTFVAGEGGVTKWFSDDFEQAWGGVSKSQFVFDGWPLAGVCVCVYLCVYQYFFE